MLTAATKWAVLRGELLEAKFDIEQEFPESIGRILDVIDVVLETMRMLDIEE